jgi:hypothetical protein
MSPTAKITRVFGDRAVFDAEIRRLATFPLLLDCPDDTPQQSQGGDEDVGGSGCFHELDNAARL